MAMTGNQRNHDGRLLHNRPVAALPQQNTLIMGVWISKGAAAKANTAPVQSAQAVQEAKEASAKEVSRLYCSMEYIRQVVERSVVP